MSAQTRERPGDPSPRVTQCVRAQDLAEMLAISVRTLYRKVARGEFPAPVRIGKGTTRWRMRDVQAYLDGRRAR